MSDRRRRLEKLAELRDVREGNKKRSSQIKDSNDSPSIFAEEEEDNPSDFIVDDEGYGYTQEEEEEIYDEYYSQERQPKKSKKSGIFNEKPKPKASNKPSVASRINNFFLQSSSNSNVGTSSSSSTNKENNPLTTNALPTDISSLLGDFLENPLSPAPKKLPNLKRKRSEIENSSSPSPNITNPQPALKNNQESNVVPISFSSKSVSSSIENSSSSAIPTNFNVNIPPSTVNSLPSDPAPQEPLKESYWKDGISSSNVEELVDVSNDSVDMNSSEESLLFYWLDAYEDKYNQPGVVFLFGKIEVSPNTFASCSLIISGIERELYVAPKKGVNVDLVKQEFEEIRKKYKIEKYRSKLAKKTYPFDDQEQVSKEKDYTFLMVLIPPNEPQFPSNQIISGKTFDHIFGINQSCLELFLLKKKILGPCWLSIKKTPNLIFEEDKLKRYSFTQHEYRCDSLNIISLYDKQKPPPPLKVMSISMKTIYNSSSNQNEIVTLSAIMHTKVAADKPTELTDGQIIYFSTIRKLEGVALPYEFDKYLKKKLSSTEIAVSERALVNYFLTKLQSLDPDVLVGHNFIGFDLDVLLHRMDRLNISNWSILGRLKRRNMPKLQSGAGGTTDSTWQEKTVTAGRLVCDTYLSAKEFLPKEKEYSLANLANTQLNEHKLAIDSEEIPLYFQENATLLDLIKNTENDAFLALRLMFKLLILPLTHQLTSLSGNLWSHSLVGGRAERIEYLLLHKFYETGFIVPDKKSLKQLAALNQTESTTQTSSAKKKSAYSGGLVLEPEKGLYDKYVLLLDFNSLYPSIIQEYNICFTTVARHKTPTGDWVDSEPPASSVPLGILPQVIRTLVEQRKSVKSLMKSETDPVKSLQLEIRQRALKLTANSMYGCLGFTHSRFFALPLAKLVTQKGRETLMKTSETAKNTLNLDVIYGDTDSIMVHTGLDDLNQAKEIGYKVQTLVNKNHTNLEIAIDGIFKPLLLLKKKKYAAIVVNEVNGKIVLKKESKGLDLVRRDWCDLSHEMGNCILDEILSGKPKDVVVENIHQYIRTQTEIIRANKVPLPKFVITKNLTKLPEEYPDKKGQPHVQVALRLKSQGKPIRVGTHIPYIICEGEGNFAERAYHPDEIKKSEGKLKVDIEWYLTQQIHPSITRLCEPIPGTDPAQIADCLGLDPSKFQQRDSTEDTYTAILNSQEKFKDVEKFSMVCRKCKAVNIFDVEFSSKCKSSNCTEEFKEKRVLREIDIACRKWIKEYHLKIVECDESSCKHQTRQIHQRCIEPGCKGWNRFVYPRERLAHQLNYFENLFHSKRHESFKTAVQRIYNQNPRRVFPAQIFSGMCGIQIQSSNKSNSNNNNNFNNALSIV